MADKPGTRVVTRSIINPQPTAERPHIGDIVCYGLIGGARRVLVEEIDDDIKNGRPGFDGQVLDDTDEPVGWTAWGYDSQILWIEREEER